jgi:ribose/xylose/arabinose/galactoside ABC-type transport system permease subunit
MKRQENRNAMTGPRLKQNTLLFGKKVVTDYRIPSLSVLLLVFMFFWDYRFLDSYNLFTVADSAAWNGIVALGFTFILLVGQLDISFGSVISLSSCVFMILLKSGQSFLVATLVALLVGIACGTLTGFFIANFRLSPFIVSMTMQLAYRGVALLITDSTPQAMSHPTLLKIAEFRLFDIFPASFLVFVVLVIAVEFILRKTQYGRNLYLVGGNIHTADNLGLKANRYIWSAFVLQGLFAAIAGVCLMTRTFSANGNIGSQSLLAVIPMVIVGGTSMAGGKGGAVKTLFGVILLSLVFNAMNFFMIPAPLQPFFKGLILLVVIVVDKYMENRNEKV